MALRFDQLISALASAVIEAQHQVQQTHIGELSRYFKKDGSPASVELQIPRVSLDTEKKKKPVSSVPVNIPLITLVNPSQLSIQEMQVTMQVDMSEIIKAAEAEGKTNKSTAQTNVPRYEWTPPENKSIIAASTTTGKKANEIGTAQITLKVTAEEPPEGLSRLLVHLNKNL